VYWGPDHWGFGGWLVMFLMMVGFWALVVLLVVWLVRGTADRRPRQGAGRPSEAIAILEERFARGEIDREEFEERRSTLLGRSAG
jgi:putative membrane protein